MSEPIPYLPKRLVKPPRIIDVSTAWDGVESVLADVMERFEIGNALALEFGVGYGYSIAALANYFGKVIGVDTFLGDEHAGFQENLFEQTTKNLSDFENILLAAHSYQTGIASPDFSGMRCDLIHIDIVHTFEDTYACGRWAVDHADVVIFHDTLSFPDVMRAVQAIADETGRFFYHWEFKHGLGILSKGEIEDG
jgi:hypothetical protein